MHGLCAAGRRRFGNEGTSAGTRTVVLVWPHQRRPSLWRALSPLGGLLGEGLTLTGSDLERPRFTSESALQRLRGNFLGDDRLSCQGDRSPSSMLLA